MAIKVISTNISTEKGTVKEPISEITINERGIEGDAHSGAWHRQVSLLSKESIEKFGSQEGKTFKYGDFAENITTEGIDLPKCSIRDMLIIGDVELEVTQIGKKCHGGGCAIYREVGKCVMPHEGIFTRVIKGGTIRAGDTVEHIKRPLEIRIITLSDRASAGEYEDRSGPAIKDALEFHFVNSNWSTNIERDVIPDDADMLREKLEQADAAGVDIIFTTGGTGIGPRDITPDVVGPMLDKEIPGIMEHIRVKYGATIPSALISRSIAGVMGTSLVYVLPGSVKAVKEYLDEILNTLNHSLLMTMGIDVH